MYTTCGVYYGLTAGTDWARLELSRVTDGSVSPVVFKSFVGRNDKIVA